MIHHNGFLDLDDWWLTAWLVDWLAEHVQRVHSWVPKKWHSWVPKKWLLEGGDEIWMNKSDHNLTFRDVTGITVTAVERIIPQIALFKLFSSIFRISRE